MASPTKRSGDGRRTGRPRRTRPDPSRHATAHQRANAFNAWRFAAHRGTRLNAWLTVTFAMLGGPNGWRAGTDPAPQTRAQRERLHDALQHWCGRHGIPAAWISAVENCPSRGPHVHLLLHLPEGTPGAGPDAAWDAARFALDRYLRRYCHWDGKPVAGRCPFVIGARRLPDRGGADAALAKLRYMVKSSSPDERGTHDGQSMTLGALAKLDRRHPPITLRPSSNAYTRRMVGCTVSIGPKARKAAGWMDEDPGLAWLSRDVERAELLRQAMEGLRAWAEQRARGVPDPAPAASEPADVSASAAAMNEALDTPETWSGAEIRDFERQLAEVGEEIAARQAKADAEYT